MDKKARCYIIIQHSIWLIIWGIFVYNILAGMAGIPVQAGWKTIAVQTLWIAFITGMMFLSVLSQVKEVKAKSSETEEPDEKTQKRRKRITWIIDAVIWLFIGSCPVSNNCGFLWLIWPFLALELFIWLFYMERNG